MLSKCHKLIGVWCAKVESIAEEWSHELVPFDIWDAYFFVPFDIWDAYNDCVAGFGTYSDPGQIWYLFRLVLILHHLDIL